MNGFSRTRLLLGKEAMEKLKRSRVAVFGLGGVGSFAAEALVRSGVGAIDVFDNDEVCLSNINRQLIALHSTIGRKKADVMKERILDINPECIVRAFDCFYSSENSARFDLKKYDYIVDAIDTVSSKLTLIEEAKKAGVPVISCMGAGNKLDPLKFEVADVYKTSVCPLAKVMRKELKARGIGSLKVVYSREEPVKPRYDEDIDYENERKGSKKKPPPGSVSFVPPAAGLVLAAEVVRDLTRV